MPQSAHALRPDDRTDAALPSNTLRLLLLDDSRFDRRRIANLTEELGRPVAIDEVGSLGDLVPALDRQVYDVALIDFSLAEGNGFEALDIIRRHDTNADVAAIMLSGNAALETAVSAMKQGCHDYLEKDGLDPAKLRTAVDGALLAQAARTTGERPSQSALDEATTEVLSRISTVCFDEMRPVLARVTTHLKLLANGDLEWPMRRVKHLRCIERDTMSVVYYLDRVSDLIESASKRKH